MAATRKGAVRIFLSISLPVSLTMGHVARIARSREFPLPLAGEGGTPHQDSRYSQCRHWVDCSILRLVAKAFVHVYGAREGGAAGYPGPHDAPEQSLACWRSGRRKFTLVANLGHATFPQISPLGPRLLCAEPN